MVLKGKTVQRKEPVPVLLTGKIWTPGLALPVDEQRPEPRHHSLRATLFSALLGAILGLLITMTWFSFVGNAPPPQTGTQAGSAGAALAPPSMVATASSTLISIATDPSIASPPLIVASVTEVASITSTAPMISIASTASLPAPVSRVASASMSETVVRKPVASPAEKVQVSSALASEAGTSEVMFPPASAAHSSPDLPVKPREEHSDTASAPDLGREIPGVPVFKRRATTFLALRGILHAEGWKITWLGRKKGVRCSNAAGDTLSLIPGKRRVVFAGRPINASIAPRLSDSGRLFVPVELLNEILGGRLSIVGGAASGKELTIRLAAIEPRREKGETPPTSLTRGTRELKRVSAIRRNGRILVCLRQVLEADGWTVEWKGMKQGAVCWKGDEQLVIAIPGRTLVTLKNGSFRSRPAPRVYRSRLHVAIASIDGLLGRRLKLRNTRLRAHETDILWVGRTEQWR